MSKHVGVQLVAPQGFDQMEAGRTYHFLRSDAQRERVLMVYFVQRAMVRSKKARRPKKWTPLPVPILIGLRRARFEEGLINGAIVEAPEQSALPPWQTGLTGKDLLRYDAQERTSKKRSHQDRIDAVLGHLWPLMLRLDEVLGAEDPEKMINAYARACRPQQNESRVRLWFFAYLVFGRSRWALHYPIHKIGRWDRFAKVGRKRGRPSLARGAQQGHGSNDPVMIEGILKGYRKYAGLGVRMSTSYRQTMLKVFGCREVSDERGYKHFVQPDGLPFPTCKQFSYRVIEAYTIDRVQLTMFGAARTRNLLRPSLGRFTEAVGNLMERAEADGYWIEEVAKSYIDDTCLPGVCVVRLRCVASGMLIGIGFSFGGETGEAYRMALFCAAIDKVIFCSLLGFEIAPEEWPSIGLPPHTITDRGPGATVKGQARSEKYRAPIIELAPSWMGQSKALIESSHPRKILTQGQPTFKPTSMTVTELCLREVVRTVRDNDSKDVSSRLNNQAIVQRVKTTPVGVWNYLDGLARNDSIPMSFETAVREFLCPIDLSLRGDGVYFKDQRFDSEALRESGLLDRVATTQETTVSGYVFPMCVRHLWVETAEGLVKVDAMLAIRDGASQLWISVAELSLISQLRREAGSLFRVHRDAAQAGLENRFEEATGRGFESRARQVGRAKRGGAKAKREATEAKAYLRPSKRRV